MPLRLLAALGVTVLSVGAGYLQAGTALSLDSGVVAAIYDGDTLTLRDGRRIRLVQIDTPELGSGECYSRAARTALLTLVPLGSRAVLQADPSLDKVDRYGRLLRYIRRSGRNVNVELVRRGAATPYFYDGDRGRYALQLIECGSRRESRQARALASVPQHETRTLSPGNYRRAVSQDRVLLFCTECGRQPRRGAGREVNGLVRRRVGELHGGGANCVLKKCRAGPRLPERRSRPALTKCGGPGPYRC